MKRTTSKSTLLRLVRIPLIHVCFIAHLVGFTGNLSVLDTDVNYPFKVAFRKQFQRWVTEVLLEKKKEGLTGAQANIEVGKKSINGVLPNWVLNAWAEISCDRIERGMSPLFLLCSYYLYYAYSLILFLLLYFEPILVLIIR